MAGNAPQLEEVWGKFAKTSEFSRNSKVQNNLEIKARNPKFLQTAVSGCFLTYPSSPFVYYFPFSVNFFQVYRFPTSA